MVTGGGGARWQIFKNEINKKILKVRNAIPGKFLKCKDE
jgi:hypothetical protein